MPQPNPSLEITVLVSELQLIRDAVAFPDPNEALAILDDLIKHASHAEAALKRAALEKAKPKPKRTSLKPLIEALEEVALVRDVARLSPATLKKCEAKGITPEALVKARTRIRREGER